MTMERFLLYLHVIALFWHQGTSSQLDIPQLCKDNGIDIPTSDSQYVDQLKLSELSEAISYLQGMLDSGCSDILGRFLCLAHLPRPNIIKNKLTQEGAPHQFLLPCYGVCRDIWRNCRHVGRELGLRPPPVFECKRYLQDDNECLTADQFYPPADTSLLNSVTRFRNNSASLEFHPQSTYHISKFGGIIRFNDTTGSKSIVCRLRNSNPFYSTTKCLVTFDRPDSYTLEIFLVNGFGEGPKMQYILEAVEDDDDNVSAEDSTWILGTSIYKVSYGSYWSCSDVSVELCPNHTKAALPNPFWPDHPNTLEFVERDLVIFSQLLAGGCDGNLNWFLCASYLPTCTEEGVVFPPCRETCYFAYRRCPPLAQFFRTRLPMPDCQNLPLRSSGKCLSEPGMSAAQEVSTATCKCEDIAIPMCQSGIPYTKTRMPNYLNMTTQYDARQYLESLAYPITHSHCSPYLRIFLCAVSVPRCFESDPASHRRVPCRELCEAAKKDCIGIFSESRTKWPRSLECEGLPLQQTGDCYDGVADEPVNDEKSEDVPTMAPAVAERRYDLKDLGLPSLFRGWVDVQGQGSPIDYCRVVTITNRQGATPFLSCALAGMQGAGEYNYNSTGAWFDAGHMDTWYMRDVNQDGRDDYCRCVGCIPETYISCLLADDGGFSGAVFDFQPPQGGCHYIRVNPFFGTP